MVLLVKNHRPIDADKGPIAEPTIAMTENGSFTRAELHPPDALEHRLCALDIDPHRHVESAFLCHCSLYCSQSVVKAQSGASQDHLGRLNWPVAAP